MPEARLQRTRATYPEMGAANRIAAVAERHRRYEREFERQQSTRGETVTIELPTSGHTDFGFEVTEPAPDHWRAPHDNAAEQIARAHSHRFVYNITDDALYCDCGERVSGHDSLFERDARLRAAGERYLKPWVDAMRGEHA